MIRRHGLTAILPCNNLDASQAFYERLDFKHVDHSDDYRIMRDERGAELHLIAAVAGWLVPGRNPFGLYLYTESVDELAAKLGAQAQEMPWGMYEFAISDPDETNVRVGWPTRLRAKPKRAMA